MSTKKIQLIIRDAGIASRRQAEEMIRHGRVRLNGQIVEDPATVADPEKDHIKVDNKLLARPDGEMLYYLFNKPRNVVSTMNDPEGRPCVGDIIRTLKKRLITIGRLDFDAEGLMILTNDGVVAQKMGHPSYKIPRTYMVKVRGRPEHQKLGWIRKGMDLGDGERVGDVQWKVILEQKQTTWLRVTLYEGKKNELKRIFFRIGHPVRKIRRIAFGPLVLGKLSVGAWRDLTSTERSKLQQLARHDGTTTTPRKSSEPRNRISRKS